MFSTYRLPLTLLLAAFLVALISELAYRTSPGGPLNVFLVMVWALLGVAAILSAISAFGGDDEEGDCDGDRLR